jgi:hypothetical protein
MRFQRSTCLLLGQMEARRRGDHQCGAHRWHGPQLWQGQADGARTRREARVRAAERGHAAQASGATRREEGRGLSWSIGEERSERAGDVGGVARTRLKASG